MNTQERKVDPFAIDFTPTIVINPLDEVFQFRWDGVPYEMPANSPSSYPAFLANHAATHLADKILSHKGKFDDTIKGDKVIYKAVSANDKKKIVDALLREGTTIDTIDVALGEKKEKVAKKEKSSDETEIRAKAKELKIKSWHVKKIEKLKEEIAAIEK